MKYDRDPRVRPEHAAPMLRLAESLGGAGPDIVARIEESRRAGRGVLLSDFWRLLKSVSASAGEETFGLSARPLLLGTAEYIFTAALQAPTLGEALRELARGYNLLHGHEYNRVETRGGLLVFVLDDEAFPYTHPRDAFLHFIIECILIFIQAAASELADEDLTPLVRQVFTRRERVRTVEGALAFWDAPIAFGEETYALAWSVEVASFPIAKAARPMALNVAVHNRILAMVEAREADRRGVEATSVAVKRVLNDGMHGQGAIATRFGISVATLRRRLASEGETFRSLYKDVLESRAYERLARSGDVADTAEALGFSDPRSFTRAFKSLTGRTPSAYIHEMRSSAPTG